MSHTNKQIGDWGECLVRRHLENKGFKFLSQNCKLGYKELDLIAIDQAALVFIEVKTRFSNRYGNASDMMGRLKIKNLKQAAMKFLNSHQTFYKSIRFDFVAVDVNRLTKTAKIRHYRDIV